MIECLKNHWQPEVRGSGAGLLCIPPALSAGRLEIDRSTRKLATAILLQALKDALVVDVKLPKNKRRTWQNDAVDWFFSPNRQPGSFNWVSEVMQTDPEPFREWIKTYIHGDRSRRRQMAATLKKARLLRSR